jgi:hypothetical protein
VKEKKMRGVLGKEVAPEQLKKRRLRIPVIIHENK